MLSAKHKTSISWLPEKRLYLLGEKTTKTRHVIVWVRKKSRKKRNRKKKYTWSPDKILYFAGGNKTKCNRVKLVRLFVAFWGQHLIGTKYEKSQRHLSFFLIKNFFF